MPPRLRQYCLSPTYIRKKASTGAGGSASGEEEGVYRAPRVGLKQRMEVRKYDPQIELGYPQNGKNTGMDGVSDDGAGSHNCDLVGKFFVGPFMVTETLYESRKTRIFRAHRVDESIPAQRLQPGEIPNSYIIKTVNSDSPNIEALAPLRHEFRVLKLLRDVEGVVSAVVLESFGKGLIFSIPNNFLFYPITSKLR